MIRDPSAEARLAALRNRAVQLSEQEQGLLARLRALREERSKVDEQALLVERSFTPSRRALPEETWRRAAREMGTFTASELATELDCSKATAKKHLDGMLKAGIVRSAGRFAGKQMYEYDKPTHAGEAFEAQQRLAPPTLVEVPPPEPVERPHDVRQSKIGSIRDKEIRHVAREAIANGWRLEHTGKGGHSLRLVRGTDTVSLASSPRNAGDSADALRKRLGLRGVKAKAS